MQLTAVAMVPALVGSVTPLAVQPTPIGYSPAPHLSARPPEASPAKAEASREISVLTYNVRGLPWPVARRRAAALREIGRELAEMRRQGRQPDLVLIQEGFRGEVADLVKLSGYKYWRQGPGRGLRAEDGPRKSPPLRYFPFGEGWGKLFGGGLHVLSDMPIEDVRITVFRDCAGYDCLANKGAMLARVMVPGVPGGIEVLNTHMNSKGASKVPPARSLRAHNSQMETINAFIRTEASDSALVGGGDFNIKGSPERYYYKAAMRPFTVVSEFCNTAAAACEGETPNSRSEPWLSAQDLQAFVSKGGVTVRPIRVSALFASPQTGGRLSDHDGYLVRYRLSWTPAPAEGPLIRTASAAAP